MTRNIAALADVFAASVDAPCLSREAIVAGLAAVFAEQDRIAALPSTPNEILIRRISQVTAMVCREYGVSESRLRNVEDKSPILVAARDAWCVALVASGLSEKGTAREVRLSRAGVRKSRTRHEARAGMGADALARSATKRASGVSVIGREREAANGR